jgi:hypothetical protein
MTRPEAAAEGPVDCAMSAFRSGPATGCARLPWDEVPMGWLTKTRLFVDRPFAALCSTQGDMGECL